VLQILDSDGKRFLQYVAQDLKIQNQNMVCTGSTWNHYQNVLYIGCFTPNSTVSTPGNMWVFTYDLHQLKVTGVVTVPQTDGFRITNSLNLFIESFPQELTNDDQVYLIAYDQGHTLTTQTVQANQARVFFNVQTGKLEFDVLVTVSMAGQEFDVLYDMFPYQNTIIVSGRIKGDNSAIILAQGKLVLIRNIVDLNPTYKTTPIGSGAVQVSQHQGTYYQFDIEARTLKEYEATGDFTKPTWGTKLLNAINAVDMPDLNEDNIWIKGFHQSNWAGAIAYGSPSYYDAGATVLDWTTNHSMYDPNRVVSVYARDYVSLGIYQGYHAIMLFRDETMLLIEGGYYSGKNKITLTATDNDGKTTVTSTLTVLDSIWEKINVRNNIGTIEIQTSTTQTYKFSANDIIDGNGLSVTVNSSNDSLLRGTGYTSQNLNIRWNGQAYIGHYYFAHDKIIVVDAGNNANLGICQDYGASPLVVQCTNIATAYIGKGYGLNNKIFAEQEITIAFADNTSRNSSYIHIFNEDGDFNSVLIPQVITDVAMMSTNSYFFVFIVYDQVSVEIRRLNKNDITEFDTYKVYNSTNVAWDEFCPHAVSVPIDSDNEFDILSDCGQGRAKAVFRMALSTNSNFFMVPISSKYNTIDFCTFKNELVINAYEGAFSIANIDTFNFWNVPLNDLDAGFAYNFFCVPALKRVAYAGHG
jgi:hypothetical protein